MKADLQISLKQTLQAGVVVLLGTRQKEAQEQRYLCQSMVNNMEGLYPVTYWHPLNAIKIPMEDTDINDFFPVSAIVTTVTKNEQDPPKLGFYVTFECFYFTSTTTIPARNKCGKISHRHGRIVMKHVSLDRGIPSEHFLNKNNLCASINPKNWLHKLPPNDPQRESEGSFCTYDWENFTNTEALLANAGQQKKLYSINLLHVILSRKFISLCFKLLLMQLQLNITDSIKLIGDNYYARPNVS